jgi:hypothetical protein
VVRQLAFLVLLHHLGQLTTPLLSFSVSQVGPLIIPVPFPGGQTASPRVSGRIKGIRDVDTLCKSQDVVQMSAINTC